MVTSRPPARVIIIGVLIYGVHPDGSESDIVVMTDLNIYDDLPRSQHSFCGKVSQFSQWSVYFAIPPPPRLGLVWRYSFGLCGRFLIREGNTLCHFASVLQWSEGAHAYDMFSLASLAADEWE